MTWYLTPVAFLTGLILQFLLDLKLAPRLVKWLGWLPLRNVFRIKPTNLRGTWEVSWDAGQSEKFQNNRDRHGHGSLRQLGSYVHAEFISQKRRYAFFGTIKGQFVVGDWYDVADETGYFGVFQLRVVNGQRLEGVWAGHSQSKVEIRSDKLVFERVDG